MEDPWFDIKHRLTQAREYVKFLEAKLKEAEKSNDYRDFTTEDRQYGR